MVFWVKGLDLPRSVFLPSLLERSRCICCRLRFLDRFRRQMLLHVCRSMHIFVQDGGVYMCPGCAHRVNALQERPEENINESIRTHKRTLTPPVQKDKSKIKVKCMNVNAWCAFQWSWSKLEIQNYLSETIKHENRFHPQAEVTINNNWMSIRIEQWTLKALPFICYILLYTDWYFT